MKKSSINSMWRTTCYAVSALLTFGLSATGPDSVVPDFAKDLPDLVLTKRVREGNNETLLMQTDLGAREFAERIRSFMKKTGWLSRKLNKDDMMMAAQKGRTLNAEVRLSVYENTDLPGTLVRVIHLRHKSPNTRHSIEIIIRGPSAIVGSAAMDAPGLLPPDGAWAKYQLSFTEEEWNHTGTLLFRMVGSTIRDDLQCRWLELEFVDRKEVSKNFLMKLLVHESQTKDGVKGIKLLDAWRQKHGEKTSKLHSMEVGYLEQFGMSIFFKIPKDPKPIVSERVIKLPKTSVQIENAVIAKTTLSGGFESTKTVWNHRAIPFGFAAINYTARDKDRLIVDVRLTVVDFGIGGKSALTVQD